MSVFLEFVVLGLATGALYALTALGVVIVYRGSRVINFAQGAVGVLGAYCFYQLHQVSKQSFIVAFIPSILLCGVVGLVIQFGIMRRLRNSSPLTHLLATLGVLALIQGLLSLHYQQQALAVSSSLPTNGWSLFGIHVGADRVLILLIVLVITAVLAVVYARTRFGRATAAVAENQASASYLGLSPDLVAGANWVIGSMLAGTAAILLAPITGLQTSQLTLLLVPALAAAVVGDMRSFPLTLAGGLAIGVAQSLAGRYANAYDWGAAAPFVVVLIALSLRGRVLPDRSHIQLKLPSVGSGRVRLLPLIVAIVVAVVLLEQIPATWVQGATETITIAIVILSITVVTGYGGQISLAQIVLAGFGGWVAGRLVSSAHLGFGPALVIGVLATLPVGIAVGLPALRTRGANLGIITLAFGVAMEALLFNNGSLTGGDVGTQVGFITLFGIKIDTLFHQRSYAVFSLIVFVLCALVVANLRRGKAGRRLLAVRANERAAAAGGVNTTLAKLYAFSVAAMIAAVGGILLAFQDSSIVYSNINAFDSVNVLGYAVIGGVGYVVGPLIGGVLQPGGLGTNIGDLFSVSVQNWLPAIGGALLILTLLTAQDGVAALEARRWGKVLDAAGRRARKVLKKEPAPLTASVMTEDASTTPGKIRPLSLKVSGLSVVFGSTKALSDLSMEVRPGEVVGLIGPNGAGKTTAIDAITGFVRPSGGRIMLGDEDITHYSPRRRAQAALSRSFQSLELFEDITVLENLLIVSESHSYWSYVSDLVRPGKPRLSPAAQAAVRLLGLQDVLHRLPTELPYGQRRLVAIARSIAAEPSILLLDEPAAGLSRTQSAELRDLLRYLADERGMGILLVEHDVDLVMNSCDRVVALVFGSEIASGTPDQVRNNAHVVHAYLGEEDTVNEEHVDSRDRALEHSASPLALAGADGADNTVAARSAGVLEQPPAVSGTPVRTGAPLLSTRDLCAGYHGVGIVHDLNLEVTPGEVAILLGANGAGKSTTMHTIAGGLPAISGQVELVGEVTRSPAYRRCRRDISFVTEERSVFRSMSVEDNLRLGRGGVAPAVELMPELEPLLKRRAGLLSGGEQQMLTLSRAIAANPAILLADELSLGLAPLIVERLLETVRAAADRGLGVLLVEQHVRRAMAIADKVYVLQRGRIVLQGTAAEMRHRLSEIEDSYLSSAAQAKLPPVPDGQRSRPAPTGLSPIVTSAARTRK